MWLAETTAVSKWATVMTKTKHRAITGITENPFSVHWQPLHIVNTKRATSEKTQKLHNFYTPEMRKTSGVFFSSIAECGELIKVIYIL